MTPSLTSDRSWRGSQGIWLPLLAIVASALVVRVWWGFSDGLQGNDPDNYLLYARQLADGTHPWRWNQTAVKYVEFVKAPRIKSRFQG